MQLDLFTLYSTIFLFLFFLFALSFLINISYSISHEDILNDYYKFNDLTNEYTNINQVNISSDFEIGELEWNSTIYEIVYQKNGSYNIFEDDIILFNPPDSSLEAAPDMFQSISMKWNDNIIPYKIDPSIKNKPELKNNIKKAIKYWDNHTIITFIELNSTNSLVYPDYVNFQYKAGVCESPIGQNLTGGEQPIRLGTLCKYGKILHEIGHTLGLWHEHSRPDWKDFISINFSNIEKNKEFNFNSTRCKSSVCESPDPNITPYDYCSIMHYGPRDFLKSELKNDPLTYTIKPINKVNGCELGQRIAPSQYDLIAINTIYR